MTDMQAWRQARDRTLLLIVFLRGWLDAVGVNRGELWFKFGLLATDWQKVAG